MKALVQDTYGSPDVLALKDIDRPAVGEHDVLIRVAAAGVDAGVLHLMTGTPYVMRLGFGLRGPRARVRGMDVAGRVEAVGRGVTRFQPGDEVYGTCSGAFAEYAATSEDKVATKPANLTFAQAAAVPTSGATALQALRDSGKVQRGQTVLVIGAAGGVGTYAVQLARSFGADVTGVCSTAKTDLVRSLGASEVIDYTRDEIGAGGRRYDLILDIAGNRALSLLRGILAPQGTLVIVGGEDGGRWFGGLGRNLRAVTVSPFVGQQLRSLLCVPRLADLEFLRERIEAGEVAPVVDRTYPLADAAEAVRYLAEGRVRGKVVVTV